MLQYVTLDRLKNDIAQPKENKHNLWSNILHANYDCYVRCCFLDYKMLTQDYICAVVGACTYKQANIIPCIQSNEGNYILKLFCSINIRTFQQKNLRLKKVKLIKPMERQYSHYPSGPLPQHKACVDCFESKLVKMHSQFWYKFL